MYYLAVLFVVALLWVMYLHGRLGMQIYRADQYRDLSFHLTEELGKERKLNFKQAVDASDRLNAVLQRAHAEFSVERQGFVSQLQAMVERLAVLKAAGGTEIVFEDGPPVAYTPTDPNNRPYSEELALFLGELEFEEGRLACEDFIGRKRVAGLADEQILALLKSGAYE